MGEYRKVALLPGLEECETLRQAQGGLWGNPLLTAKACCRYRVKFARLLERAVAVIVEFFNSYGDGLLHIVEKMGPLPSAPALACSRICVSQSA
jgi:hypothetical protein